MVDAGKDQLQRAALAADHEVEAARIAGQALLELGAEQQKQHDGADPERQQREIERRVLRPGADVGEAQAKEAHGRSGSSRRWVKCVLRRASWVAIRRVAPEASAWVRSSASDGRAVRIVESGGRLVGQDQRRAIDHGAGDRHALGLALAQPIRSRFGQSAQAEARNQSVDPRRIGGQAGERTRETEVVTHGQRPDQMQALQHDADRPAAKPVQLGRRQRAQIPTRHPQPTTARAQKAGDEMQKRALAGARRPEDQAVLAGSDRPRRYRHDSARTVGPSEAVQHQNRLLRGGGMADGRRKHFGRGQRLHPSHPLCR